MPGQYQREEVGPVRPLLQEGGKVAEEGQLQSPSAGQDGDAKGRGEGNTEIPRSAENSISKDCVTDFDEILKEIDNEILENHHHHHPVVTEILQNLSNSDVETSNVGQITTSQALVKEDLKIRDKGEIEMDLTRGGFKMGWAELKDDSKVNKVGKKEGSKKAQALKNVPYGPSKKPNVSQGSKKGCWTRTLHAPRRVWKLKPKGM